MVKKSLYFTEEHELFRQSVRQFVQAEVIPFANEWEEKRELPKSIWKKMGELGFLGVNHQEAFGGSNNDFFYSVVLLEEMAKSGLAGFAAAHSVHQFMSTAHLAKAGSEELKQKYLPGAINGTLVGGLAVTEPGAGSDVANIRTTAKREGDYYIVNGQKTFITNGVYGDFVTVAVKTDPAAGPAGISLLVIDQGSAGFRSNKLNKMGWHSSDTAELFFENVKVPASNLIGQENQGFYYIMESFQLERLVAGVSAIAGCDLVIETTLKYINEREAFGKQIKKFQVVRHALVDLATEVEAARQLTYHTAWLFQNNLFAVKECSMVKLLGTELGKKAADVCLQFFGGYGYMEEYPIARMYRDARVGTIVGGTSEIMKEILAKIIIDGISYESAYESMKQQEKQAAISAENTLSQPIQKQSETMSAATPETAREIILSLPSRFKQEKAEGITSTVHFDITGPNGGAFSVMVNNNTCVVEDGFHGEPSCVVSTSDQTYEDTELGRTNPQMAVMMGKIKISNLGEMMKFIGLFRRLA
ncbi:MAG: acyl-CoA dehydrogenase family protein [Chitinophagales bacterium]|nr:acyl-CoA dehydrogenase family protein [Chitinophagales bacterium]